MLLHMLVIIIFFFAVIIIAESIYDNSHFVVRRYELCSDKISRDVRICLLTDLHGNSYGSDNEKLLKAIDENKPDLIIAAGDMISSYNDKKRSGEKTSLSLMQKLACRYKVFYSNGNHEYKWKKLTEIFGDTYNEYAVALRSMGVILLENEAFKIDDLNICIIGLEIQHYYYHKFFKRAMPPDYIDSLLEKESDKAVTAMSSKKADSDITAMSSKKTDSDITAMSSEDIECDSTAPGSEDIECDSTAPCSKDAECDSTAPVDKGAEQRSRKSTSYRILCAHNPVYFENYADWGADLTVSGHVHGGIMRLPVLGGVISPALSLFPKYDGGKFMIDGHTMILSRGLGTHTIPVRVFNPGELVVIDIKKGAEFAR